jgi:hypothetical protein
MIRTIADLLDSLRRKEAAALAKWNLQHNPLTGDMYEGLTKHLLDRAIFEGLDLRVVDGKITNDSGALSDQIDCMLVRGGGSPIPYTNSFIYPIGQVLAVIESKKTLYSTTLADAYLNLASVTKLNSLADQKLKAAASAFRYVARREALHEFWPDLSVEDKMLFICLAKDSIAPLRIVLGYEGFVSELGLRNAFLDYLKRQLVSREERKESDSGEPAPALGPHELPSLIICRDSVLLKLNGMPYSGYVEAHALPTTASGATWWTLYGSSSGNPILFLLEVIWTRLRHGFGVPPEVFGEDLELERIAPLLFALPVADKGWQYLEHRLSESELENVQCDTEWQPCFPDDVQSTILHILCRDEEIDLDNDPDLQSFLVANGTTTEELVTRMQATGLVYLDPGRRLRLLTEQCRVGVLPDGRWFAGEDSTGRLTRWSIKFLGKFRAHKDSESSRP